MRETTRLTRRHDFADDYTEEYEAEGGADEPAPRTHVAALNDLADRIADTEGIPQGRVPYVDPAQRGIRARALVLLDNPSTQAEVGTGTGMLSLDNPDHTARNCRDK